MRKNLGRLILLAYDFPPLVRSGSYRPLRFARTVAAAGREVVVITASEWNETRTIDTSLLGDRTGNVSVKRILSFSSFLVALEKVLGKVGLGGLVYHLRKRVLFPDEQVLWAVAACLFVLSKRPRAGDIVLTSSPPWSAHLAGLFLKRFFGVTWIADHRDAWTQNFHFRGKGRREAELHARLEALCHAHCDAILTASRMQAEEIVRRFGVLRRKVRPLYTGYDEEDFRQVRVRPRHELLASLSRGEGSSPPVPRDPFVIIYAGAFYGDYFPGSFLEGLSEFLRERPEERKRLRAVFFLSHGRDRVHEECKRLGLLDAVLLEHALPHAELPAFLLAADALLLVVPDIPGALACVPGKIFEYIASGRPVLAVVPPGGEAASLVASYCGGIVVRPGEAARVARALEALIGGKGEATAPREETRALSWSVLSRDFESLVGLFSPEGSGMRVKGRLKVALAASGLGIVERGVESFTEELGGALAADFDVSLFGGGSRGGSHRRIGCIGRNNKVTNAIMRCLSQPLRRFIRRLRLDPLGLEKLTFSLSLLAALIWERHDILIHSDGFWGGLSSRLTRRLTGVRIISVGHGGLGGALEEIGQSSDLYVNVNSTIVEELRREFPEKRISSFPPFVDVSRFKPGASPLDLHLERPVFLTVGALEEEKRIDLAVKALARLGKGSLLIVGSGSLEESLRRLGMRELGQERFHIARASREDMVHYYNFSDVFTLPSPREAFPLSVLEAMACDLPVVTVTEGTRGILGNGCLVPCDPSDEEGYAGALATALGLVGSGRSRKRALHYSREVVGREWRELVLEVYGK
jgi:glycosyltransferase involved in cell wall biosynthesis